MDTSDDRHSEGPQVLSYSSHDLARRERWRRLARRLVLAGTVCFALVLNGSGLDQGHRMEICRKCGAHSMVKHTRFFGFGSSHRWNMTHGPVSRLIQEYGRQHCTHNWELIHSSGVSLLKQYRGGGRGISHATLIGNLEGSAVSDDVLQAKAEADPAFVDKLKWAIADPDDPARERFLFDLTEEVYMAAQTQPSR